MVTSSLSLRERIEVKGVKQPGGTVFIIPSLG